MENGISELILQIIDAVWIYLIPIFFLYLAKDFISNFICWIKMKATTISYYAVGGEVKWDGKIQVIQKVGFTKIVLFYDEDNKRHYTVIHNIDYYKSQKKFIGKF